MERRPIRDRLDDGALYELETPKVRIPALSGQVVVRPDVDRVIDAVAADLVIHAENCVREFGDFHLALSAGPEFEGLYTRLMYDPNYRRIPWRRTHLWFVHERCLPADDERTSYRMVQEIIGDHADIPAEQIHPMAGDSPTGDADYESQIRDVLAWREKGQDRLDYVLLAMGPTGETAGAAPETAAASLDDDLDGGAATEPRPDDATTASPRLVRRVPAADAVDGFALAPSFLNVSRFVAVLVTGEAMAPAVARLEGRRGRRAGREDRTRSEDAMLIERIAPLRGELKWYLDEPACGSGDDGEGG